MAFCPNCGTPNTDQAEKCVACGFELATPKQKPKFKGTIMMSGIKAPTQAEPPAAPPPASPAVTAPLPVPSPASAPSSSATSPGSRNIGFEKTMLGRPAAGLPVPGMPPAEPTSAREHGPAAAEDPAQAPTVQQLAPTRDFAGRASAPTQEAPASFAEPAATRATPELARTSGAGPQQASYTFGDRGAGSTVPPRNQPPAVGKIVALGCAGVLALSCLVGGLLYVAFGDKLKALLGGGASSEDASQAAAWQASIAQSLAQVSALCAIDCDRASVFFHPDTQAQLLPQAKALTSERVQKLSDAREAHAEMLDGSDDEELAKKLGLDPQLCARVSVAKAKVVSCSVPDTQTGTPGVLRIVHLSGISEL